MSVVMQSSSAATAATHVAVHAGSLTFEQACAMIVGQSVGTAAASALVAIGAGLAVRRAAMAHIVYNVSVGIIGILLLGPIVAMARWVGTQFDQPNGVLPLAAFSRIFKLLGILAFYPWLDRFSHIIERITEAGVATAVGRLDPVLAEAGGAVALEAAGRAILELAHGSVDAVRCRLIGEPLRDDPPFDEARQIEQFLQSLSLETLDLGAFEPRLVRLCHALGDLTRVPPDASGWQPPADSDKAARALAAWLDTTKHPEAVPGAAIFKAIADASNRLANERTTGRDKILQDVALQHTPTETARGDLVLFGWAERTF